MKKLFILFMLSVLAAGLLAQPVLPPDQKWILVEELSDEFDQEDGLDREKWND